MEGANQPLLEPLKFILIVDDDEEDRELFKAAITDINGETLVLEIDNCRDIIEEVASLIVKPEVIFLDINMPVVNGKECLQKILNSPDLKDIPVIMYSTSNNSRDIYETYQIGAKYYIQKPTTYDNLLRLLKLIIHKVLPFDSPPSLIDYFLNARLR